MIVPQRLSMGVFRLNKWISRSRMKAVRRAARFLLARFLDALEPQRSKHGPHTADDGPIASEGESVAIEGVSFS